jgi:hypothetical protein
MGVINTRHDTGFLVYKGQRGISWWVAWWLVVKGDMSERVIRIIKHGDCEFR